MAGIIQRALRIRADPAMTTKNEEHGPDSTGDGWAEDVRVAASFLTRLSLGVAPPAAGRLAAAAWSFPLVGMGVGLLGAGAFGLAHVLGAPAPLAAIAAVGAQIWATGALHEDGLGDFADALGGPTRRRKLAIMRDARIGTYGVIALVLGLAARIAAIAAVAEPAAVVGVLIAAGAVSRAAVVWMMHGLAPARADGLGAQAGRPERTRAIAATALAAAALLWLDFGALVAGVVVAALAAAAVSALARRHLGGQTGDVLGAGQQAAEALFLAGLASAAGA